MNAFQRFNASNAKLFLVSLFFSMLLQGCASQNISNYQNAKPALVMSDFFSGELEGWGMFQGRNGEVTRRFYVTISTTQKDNNHITLDERFSWADGTKSTRVWQLTKQTNSTWTGTAGDVVGQATGKIAGNALHWQYILKLPVKDNTYEVAFDDWMYLISPDVMLNRSVMSKYGVELGSVTLSLHKVGKYKKTDCTGF